VTTSGRRCAGCGSPLPETAALETQVKCSFCGLVNDLADAGSSRRPLTINVDVGSAGGSAAGRTVAAVVVLGIALVSGLVFYTVHTAMRPVNDVVRTVTNQVPQLTQMAEVTRAAQNLKNPAKVKPSDLKSGTLGWAELDVPAPSSGWAAFEPVTDLRWATDIARAWQADARLTRIDVDRLKDTGTIDVSAGPDNAAGYRFESPSQIGAWERIADRDSHAAVGYELMIKLAEQKVKALVVKGEPRTDRPPTEEVDSHPLPELLALAAKDPHFAPHPFFEGYMVHLEREGWVWYLQSLSRRESEPRIRARDGALYPYALRPAAH
jgi:hypothetical protein